MLDKLRTEEQNEILNQIVSLTEQGKMIWQCVDYNPLSFMNKDDYDESPAYLCQIFKLQTTFQGIPYEMELAEYITIPAGKGNVAVTISRNFADDFLQIDEMLSSDLAYDDCFPEDIADVFKDNPAMVLSTVLVPQIADTEVVKGTFVWARFINEKGVSAKLLRHPLTQLGEKLFDEQRVLDYHRILFDIPYRDSLLGK